jgi:signal-transduction protein with cAMP-binding, CBS, and nucleotidyltransferase domain
MKQIEYFEPSVTNYSMFYDELQYQLDEENHEAGTEVIKINSKCSKLIFIIEGELNVEVMNCEGNVCIIDVLQKGDVIG